MARRVSKRPTANENVQSIDINYSIAISRLSGVATSAYATRFVTLLQDILVSLEETIIRRVHLEKPMQLHTYLNYDGYL